MLSLSIIFCCICFCIHQVVQELTQDESCQVQYTVQCCDGALLQTQIRDRFCFQPAQNGHMAPTAQCLNTIQNNNENRWTVLSDWAFVNFEIYNEQHEGLFEFAKESNTQTANLVL